MAEAFLHLCTTDHWSEAGAWLCHVSCSEARGCCVVAAKGNAGICRRRPITQASYINLSCRGFSLHDSTAEGKSMWADLTFLWRVYLNGDRKVASRRYHSRVKAKDLRQLRSMLSYIVVGPAPRSCNNVIQSGFQHFRRKAVSPKHQLWRNVERPISKGKHNLNTWNSTCT